MRKPCNKYYSNFIFLSSEAFKTHLNSCKDCQNKFDEINEIENLIKFSKPAYIKRKANSSFFQLNRLASCLLIFTLGFYVYNNADNIYLFQHDILHPEIAEVTQESIFNKLSLPTDEYGILDTNRKFVNE